MKTFLFIFFNKYLKRFYNNNKWMELNVWHNMQDNQRTGNENWKITEIEFFKKIFNRWMRFSA